jgi:hypothetical protein
MKLVVIESPYAGRVADHVSYARRCLLDSLRRGESPIASHLLHTQVLDDTVPEERCLGMAAGHAWIRRSDLVAVYVDYGYSTGMHAGIAEAKRHGVPVEVRSLA